MRLDNWGRCPTGGIDEIRVFLNAKAEQYNRPAFIDSDPVSIPHLFSRKQDIEIMGFWAAVLAWGQRKTIIAKCRQLIEFMDGAPYDFIKHHQPADLKPFLLFKHRTFNATDVLYFIEFFRQHYARHESLETAFSGAGSIDAVLPPGGDSAMGAGNKRPGGNGQKNKRKGAASAATGIEPLETSLNQFRRYFFSLPEFPRRTMKHIPAPERDSACKRLNMFLRWMVRRDDCGVDFGLWRQMNPAELICPFDVHVERVARKLGLITRPRGGWQTALELTRNLRKLDPSDPVRYDFALFGMGVAGEI